MSIENLGLAQGNFRPIATDAPFQNADVTSAKVNGDKIEAEDINNVRKVVKETPMTIDLDLSPGQYKRITLSVSNRSVGLKDGWNTTLKNPSSEIKVSINPPINVQQQLPK